MKDTATGNLRDFKVEYAETSKMQINVLLIDRAAEVGVWTVSRSGQQCLLRKTIAYIYQRYTNCFRKLPHCILVIPESPAERPLGETPVKVSQKGRKSKAKKIPATKTKTRIVLGTSHSGLRAKIVWRGRLGKITTIPKFPHIIHKKFPGYILTIIFLRRVAASRIGRS